MLLKEIVQISVVCWVRSVADPETSEGGGARNMKYKLPHVAAIFFLAYFGPLAPPPGSAIGDIGFLVKTSFTVQVQVPQQTFSTRRYLAPCGSPD